ncbi:MAG: hypothetical protein ACLVJH_02715 [Faecalibacterium prausnitzii]
MLYYNLLLQRIAYYFNSVEAPPLSDRYTERDAAATRSAQAAAGSARRLAVADADTWTAVEALSLQLAAHCPNPDRDTAGQADAYPGRAIERGQRWRGCGADRDAGSTAAHMLNCGEDYVTENCRFGPKDTAAVRAAQQRAEPAGKRASWTGRPGPRSQAQSMLLRLRGGMRDGTAC